MASKALGVYRMRSPASWGVASLLTSLITGMCALTAFAQTPAQSQVPHPTRPAATPQSATPPGNDQAQPGTEQPAAEPPSGNDQGLFVFKKQVEEVVLHATVVDDHQHLVTGLSQKDFSVSENGVPQKITSFRREDVPVEIGIVVDNSGSMREKRESVKNAVYKARRASTSMAQVFVVI